MVGVAPDGEDEGSSLPFSLGMALFRFPPFCGVESDIFSSADSSGKLNATLVENGPAATTAADEDDEARPVFEPCRLVRGVCIGGRSEVLFSLELLFLAAASLSLGGRPMRGEGRGDSSTEGDELGV